MIYIDILYIYREREEDRENLPHVDIRRSFILKTN